VAGEGIERWLRVKLQKESLCFVNESLVVRLEIRIEYDVCRSPVEKKRERSDID